MQTHTHMLITPNIHTCTPSTQHTTHNTHTHTHHTTPTPLLAGLCCQNHRWQW